MDYSVESITPELEQTLHQLALDLRLDLEAVLLAEFIPIPPETEQRRRFVRRYGQVDIYIFDPYSIALSKIARGFESDLEEVEFLLSQGFIAWDALGAYLQAILPRARGADIDPKEFRQYFETLKHKMER